MNFTPFSAGGGAAGAAGAHYVTAGQFPKFQQAVPANGIGQVVMSDGGVQYVRTLEGGAALQQATPQIITLPFALPGAKPGDPQQTMQIQVLAPGLLQQGVQQPKYHMQIPIQGFQQGALGAVLTVAYTPETMEGLQLLGNSVPEGAFRNRPGMQLVTLQSQDLPLQQQDGKEQQAILIPNAPQLLVQPQEDRKNNNSNNNNNNNNNNNSIQIKEECDDTNDEESSELGEHESNSEGSGSWQAGATTSANQEIANYLSKLPQQQALPASLQQFLRLNPDCMVKLDPENGDAEKTMDGNNEEEPPPKPKKKKKYKKKPLKPARPKPGQVVIAQALDGTPIYCCPECHMAYPEKEQLELHLGVHKIERRFICGICGAGLKRKEHLERHKLGHNPERPYVCSVCHKGFKRKEHLNLHTVIHSGEKSEVCQECGKGFYRKDHLRKHARSHQRRGDRLDGLVSIAPGPEHLTHVDIKPALSGGDVRHNIVPEITIHVPTSGNMQVPVQISVPHHIVSTLANGQQHVTLTQHSQQQQQQQQQHHIDVDELLTQHS